MRHLNLTNIASACGGLYMGDDCYRHMEIKGAVIDSRQVKEGYLFIPIKGERVDGHDFIASAYEKGALAVLSEHFLPSGMGPYIRVPSCREALKDLAVFYRSQLKIPVIGVTGSVGKTSTKEMIASVLFARYHVLKTDGNFNNEIGLPLTMLRIQEEHEAAVVEMGISDFGEMHRLANIARPDVCVITNIGTCHLENLGDRDGVLRAKTEVFDHIEKDAAVILNGDDDKLITVKEVHGKKPIFYGLGNRTLDITMDQIENLGLAGTRACLHTPQGDIEVEIPIPGIHNLYNAMAAAAVGLHVGLTPEEIRRGIASAKTIGGRSNLIEANGILIVDDCYNANPMSMRASLDVLKTATGRKIAVLGDMGELGENERQLHYEVGAYAADAGIDALFCVGELAAEIMRGAKENGNEIDGCGQSDGAADAGKTCGEDDMQIFYYRTREEVLSHLQQFVKKGDTVLVKASHFMDFPKIVEALKTAEYLQ